jgi:hypothetical protein
MKDIPIDIRTIYADGTRLTMKNVDDMKQPLPEILTTVKTRYKQKIVLDSLAYCNPKEEKDCDE